MSALWSEEPARASLKQAGMTRIHHIDRTTFSILRAVYRKRTLIIYGD
jgi:hypothetical protein